MLSMQNAINKILHIWHFLNLQTEKKRGAVVKW